MACKKYREKIILHLYGELKEEETKMLLEHVKECAECAEDLAYTQKVFHVLEETKTAVTPEARWEKCWNTIDAEIKKRQSKQKSFLSLPRWAYATAAMIFVFLVGLYIGRIAFLPSQSKEATLEGTQSAMNPTLQEHLESLKPVLVEYANYTGSEEKGTITIDKELVRGLIIQNILLKRMVAEKNPSMKQLLEDVDLVLREIANQEDDDKETLAMIQEIIQERGILYEIEVSKTI